MMGHMIAVDSQRVLIMSRSVNVWSERHIPVRGLPGSPRPAGDIGRLDTRIASVCPDHPTKQDKENLLNDL